MCEGIVRIVHKIRVSVSISSLKLEHTACPEIF